MTLEELKQDTPEADTMARRILTALYECAMAAQGSRLGEIKFERKNEPRVPAEAGPLARKWTACPR